MLIHGLKVLFFVRRRALVAEGSVASLAIVEQIEVLEDVLLGLFPGGVAFAVCPFGFELAEEALHRSFVPAVALAAR